MALGFLTPPKIPEPVKPDDFTASERERLRGVITDGDPLRERRDQTAIDRLLTNSVTEITGPTGAFTLAQRQHADDNIAKNIADFLGQSSQMEEERRFQAEGRLGELEADRKRDLDEYEQLQASHQAAEEVARKNWQSGLLRAGAGLLSVAAPGIGAGINALTNLGDRGDEGGLDYEPSIGMTAGDPSRWFDTVGRQRNEDDELGMLPTPSFGDMSWNNRG